MYWNAPYTGDWGHFCKRPSTLLVNLQCSGIKGNVNQWTKSCTTDNAGCWWTYIQEHTLAARRSTRWSSLTNLYVLFINDLVPELQIPAALYLDDLVLWCQEEYEMMAMCRMYLVLDKITAWVDNFCHHSTKRRQQQAFCHYLPKRKLMMREIHH